MNGERGRGPDFFYPVAPDAHWVERFAWLGARTIQLRWKGENVAERVAQIRRSLAATRTHGRQLIVNDYWREAIDTAADYVHLGQEDLASADTPAIRRANIRIGVSTHDESELDAALAVGADYVALGPIYATTLKAMRWAPQGLDRLRDWKSRIGDIPLVAIGGFTLERADGAVAAGASSVAVVTDVVANPDPDRRLAQWVAWADEKRVVNGPDFTRA